MNKQEAQDLLPWFVAGTLNETEQRAVQAFIDSGEITAAEVDELQLFAEAVTEQSAVEPAYDPTLVDVVLKELDNVPQDLVEPVIVAEPQPTESWLDRLLQRLQWNSTPRVARMALAGQFAVLVAVGGMVASQTGQDGGGAYYDSVSGPVIAAAADIQLAIKPGVTEAQFRTLLSDLDAQIVSGPNSMGMYTLDLGIEDTEIAALTAELKNHPHISFVAEASK